MGTEYIADKEHYDKVLAKVSSVKHTLWIATADIKDLHVMSGSGTIPFLGLIAKALERGVQVRLMHAQEPGPIFREDFDRYPILISSLERALCPRISIPYGAAADARTAAADNSVPTR